MGGMGEVLRDGQNKETYSINRTKNKRQEQLHRTQKQGREQRQARRTSSRTIARTKDEEQEH